MGDWHGYAVVAVTGTPLPPADSVKVADKLKETGKQQSAYPHELTQIRASLDGTSFIVETTTPAVLDKSTIVKQIALALGLPELATANLTDFQLFAGKDWEESRTACAAYLQSSQDAWEVPDDPKDSGGGKP